MVYTIQNDHLCASVQSLGAQLCSLREVSTGREHLWQGDPAVWSGQAPLLFPVIGRLNGGKYRWAGQEYAMPKHGFARKREFALESQSASQLTLLLRDDENTRAIYPFSFELRLTFALEGNALSVRHSVVNTGAGNMPFCLGAHPGFFCAEGDVLALDAPETLALYRLDAEKMLLKPEPLPYPVPDGRISLSHALFQEDAMMFDGIRSRSITLLRQDGSRVRVEYGAAPCLGVWSQPKPPLRYVCLEPWYGLDDFVDFAGDFSQKPHCQVLAAGQSFAFPMRIVIGM